MPQNNLRNIEKILTLIGPDWKLFEKALRQKLSEEMYLLRQSLGIEISELAKKTKLTQKKIRAAESNSAEAEFEVFLQLYLFYFRGSEK